LGYRCLRCACIRYVHMDGNAVVRDFIMVNRHFRMGVGFNLVPFITGGLFQIIQSGR